MNLKRLAKRALATLSLSMLCLIAFAQGHQISGTVIDGTGAVSYTHLRAHET